MTVTAKEHLPGLRALVPAGNAVVGIDLTDVEQAIVVTDDDARVLARLRLLCRAWVLPGKLRSS
ncbi:hypothetical protein [Rugosimonospora africana]|uniref:hypothetical protein n=1 Tax=Rugosimonospora africana TaxID=556532 RepID=UPI00194206AC|nr:hypothetical protein [Rugosimonospora africana]